MRKQIKVIVSLLLSVMITAGTLAGCGDNSQMNPEARFTFVLLGEDDEGEIGFTSLATDEHNIVSFRVTTRETTVGAALLEQRLISGTVGDFGLMVEVVDGVRASDGAWWAFYIGEEMAMQGVDATEITEGVTYAFKYTPS
jgi:hypothetical protein